MIEYIYHLCNKNMVDFFIFSTAVLKLYQSGDFLLPGRYPCDGPGFAMGMWLATILGSMWWYNQTSNYDLLMLISFPVQAKPETVDKGREIVKKQWALSTDSPVTGASKFAALGADSLDTVLLGIFIATSESVFCFVLLLTSSSGQVEVVMGLEEEFGIGVGEEHCYRSTRNWSYWEEASGLLVQG